MALGVPASGALGESLRRYSSTINARLRVTGHLFQARQAKCALIVRRENDICLERRVNC